MSENEELTLKDLCEESGLPERTVRFYMAKGIIPPAPRTGPGVRYPRAHLTRLRLLRKWQDAQLPLEQIGKLLAGLDDAGVERMYRSQTAETARAAGGSEVGSATDYIRKALGKTSSPTHPAAQMPPLPPTEDTFARSQWERFVVDDDVEIHVRRPLHHTKNRRVEALLQEARRLLKETL